MATSLLSGCLGEGTGTGDFVSRFRSADATDTATGTATEPAERPAPAADAKAEHSQIIETLQARRSLLPDGSAYDRVAEAVLAANSRAAEAELRSARLRAEAASKNWLPTIGPSISLTSLADFVASLVVEQVIFDNGRKKAEREFARADVEVAAVALSEDTNKRVADALGLYLTAEEGRATAARTELALKDMGHFEWVMSERVQGGIGNPADLAVIRQKLSELRAERDRALAATRAALAELDAMSALPLGDLSGATPLAMADQEDLSVIRAEAEKNRRVAEARMTRAAALPGLSARISAGTGKTDAGLHAGGGQIGFGTPAQLQAAAATEDAARRQVAEAREIALRRARARAERIAALDAETREAHALAAQAKSNLDLFQRQYEAGLRQVMDVVGVYETWMRAEARATETRFRAARLRVEAARDSGQLAEGSKV